MSPRSARGSKPAPNPVGTHGTQVEDGRDETLSHLRRLVMQAGPTAVEEVKWRRPGNPDGAPVRSHDGIICVGNVLKNAVRLTFPNGARIRDPKNLFNTRLDSKTVRAIDVHAEESVDEKGLANIIRDAVALNLSKAKNR